MRANGIAYNTGFAAGLGLEVWFSPYPIDLTPEQIHALFLDCTDRAERLRVAGAEVAGQFRADVRSLTAGAKPIAVTGFGTAAWRGAGDVAPRSMEIVEHDPATRAPLRLAGPYERDEEGQATYFRELLEIFDSEGVDSAFAYLFALDDYPHRPGGDPRDDLDLASPGIVKVLEGRTGDTYPGLPWEPKAAFAAIARHYAVHSPNGSR